MTGAGIYPVKVRFSAAVRQADGWNAVDFHVAPSVLQPVVLQGLAAETQFQFPGAARPDRSGSDFLSYPARQRRGELCVEGSPGRKRKANCSIPPRCCRKSTCFPA